jgi:hypothetical protein
VWSPDPWGANGEPDARFTEYIQPFTGVTGSNPAAPSSTNAAMGQSVDSTFTFTAQSMGEVTGKGPMTPSPRPSAVRVTALSFHSERQGQATSVQGNENICTEVAVYSPTSSESRTTNQTDSRTNALPKNDSVSKALRETLLTDGGAPGSKITNGDLLAWL